MTAKLALGRKVGYGVGDFGFGLFFLTASQFLLYYYTDVLGLDPATAGWVFGGAVVWDAIWDPVMGALANRTRTRWGRYRPYLLFAGVPLAMSWVLIFLPNNFSGTSLIVYALLAHLLFRTCYACASMPYLALSAAMTEDSTERSSLAGFRLVFQAFAGVLVAFVTLPLAEALGGGQPGFFKVALMYGVVAAAVLIIVFAATREVTVGEGLRVRPSFGAMIRMLQANRAFWLVCGAFLIGSIANVFFNKSLPYFMKYGLDRPQLIGPALGILALTITFSIPLWTYVSKRTSKRTTFLIGTVIALAAYVGLWFAPTVPPAWLSLIAVLGFGSGAVFLSTWAMMPDTVEYGEWKSGVRAEGAVFGFVSLVQKASLGLAAGLLGEVLSAIGYTANAVQTPETLESLRVVMLGVPALFTALAAISVLFYPLDARTHGRLVTILQRRRARAAVAPAE